MKMLEKRPVSMRSPIFFFDALIKFFAQLYRAYVTVELREEMKRNGLVVAEILRIE